MDELAAVSGWVTLELRGPDGSLRFSRMARNLITAAGDAYHAGRVAAALAPAALPQPPVVTGMKLGTGSLPADKAGPGAVLTAYLPGAAAMLSGVTVLPLDPVAGCTVEYRAVFGPGVGTGTQLAEAVLVTDAATDADSLAAAVIARVVFGSPTPKPADETAQIVWAHTFLGSGS